MTEPPTFITAKRCSGEENFSMYLLISFSDPMAPSNFKIVFFIN
jgi:hypothetical protein